VAITVVPSAYGRAASLTLRNAVADAKRADPLTPVTVIVPTNSVGVAARRLLASGELAPVVPNGRGIVGVSFHTVYRLAELLGAPRLAAEHRRPVSTAVLAAAVRHVLARSPGVFAPVAAHPATEEALVGAYRELGDLDAEQLDVLATQHLRAREVVRVVRAVRARLAPRWYDEHDLMDAARVAIDSGSPLLRDLGTIVCYLPQRWSGPAARVVQALEERTKVVVIAGFTGVPAADAAVVASLARVGVKIDENHLGAIEPATGDTVVSASDPDDEVRAIVRELVGALRTGVPLERMAVLYGPDEPYARLLHEHLDGAGIAHNGASVRLLADTVFGRTLLRMLSLADRPLTRDDVCALFSGAPLLNGRGREVPGMRWERVSRKAGVVAGVEQWHARLDAYGERLGESARAEYERRDARDLRAFVDELARALDAHVRASSWKAWADWARRLGQHFLGSEEQRTAWPAIERDAATRVELALDRLGRLDTVEDAPSLDVFRRSLAVELDAAHERIGRLGDGVLVGPVSFALGVELERVWICGLAEGVFPAVPRDDALLGDRERAVLAGELPLRIERVDDGQRALLAALAATQGTRACTWPRGDLRRSTEHVPSRFLQSTLTRVPADRVLTIGSYVQGIVRAECPATAHEFDVRGALADDPAVSEQPAVARSRALVVARASAEFTRFDGNLAMLGDRLRAVSPLGSDTATSPTGLELWADCPHAYFMERILRVEPVERPEEIMQLSPLDRGALVHEVLDRFLGRPENERTRATLRAIAEAVCAPAEARGLTGRPLLWQRDRRLLLAELDAFFDAHEEYVAQRGITVLATEHPFGLRAEMAPPVALAWPDGRALLMRGQADRIDRTNDGTLVVLDYKTGSPDRYKSLSADDPVLAGTCLQLPVYARAAAAAFSRGDDAIEAYYWFVGRGGNRLIGYALDASIDAAFMDAVRAIVDGIEAGVFVAIPPPPGPSPFVRCRYCDPDGLGTADRWREWERKHAAPELMAIHASESGKK
jgi:RecB family exonuclease